MRADHCLLEGLTSRGESENFAKLVRRYYRPLLAFCTRMMGCPYRAEDIVQESFIKSYRYLDNLRNGRAFKSWLYRIAINTARNELRLKREEPMEIEDHLLNPAPSAAVTLARSGIAQVLRQFVEELPKRQKQALCLRIYDDLSFKEIAQIMSCPYDTAKANYRHAILKLKDVLESHSLQKEDLHVPCKWSEGSLNKIGVKV